jgi:hypothetical protein
MSETPQTPQTPPPPPQHPGHDYGGYPKQPYYPPLPQYGVVAVRQPTNPVATAAMVLGILCCVFVAAGLAELAMCVLAMTFGAMGLERKRAHLGGRGKAQAGLILGIIGIVIYLIVGIASAGITLLI